MARANYTLEIYLQSEVEDALPMFARTREEVDSAVDRLTAAAAGFNHNPAMHVAERPKWDDMPDHELRLDIDPEAGMAALRYFGPDDPAGQVTLGEPSSARLYRDIDSATEFPTNAAITLDHLRAAVHEFRESGGRRPRCVEWQEADGW